LHVNPSVQAQSLAQHHKPESGYPERAIGLRVKDGAAMQDLLQLMYQDGHLSSTELAALRRTSRQLRENPVRVLRSLNVATPGEIKELLQRYYGFAAATDKLIEEIDDSLRPLIPADVALHYCVLPIAEENGEIYVLMEDPTDKGVINQLQFFLEKKIVPLIATVQQLSSGLCRLYGVEPGRLKLSGLLEASRGAVGVSLNLNLNQTHFVDDSQPLLDDEVFKRLKVEPKKKPRKQATSARVQAPRPAPAPPEKNPENGEFHTPAAILQETPVSTTAAASISVQVNNTATSSPAPEPIVAVPASPGLETIPVEPELVSAVNVLGLRLALAETRSQAVSMTNERLAEFSLTLQIQNSGQLLIVWKGISQEIDLDSPQAIVALPQVFRGLVKKIAQCRAG
jgi:hypothetical protein